MRANLAYREHLENEDAAVEPTAVPAEVARLYDELRDCIRTNDQQGVRRIFGELVLARRPISEISGVVESLSKAGSKEGPEASRSLPADSTQHQAAPPFVESAPGPVDQDPEFEEPASEPGYRHTEATAAPDFVSESPVGDPFAATSEAEDDAAALEDPDPVAEWTPQISDPAAALASVRESLQYGAIAANHTAASRSADRVPSAAPARGRQTGRLSAKAGIGAAAVAVLVIAASGVFLLTHPTIPEGLVGTMSARTAGATSSADLRAVGAPAAGPASHAAAPNTGVTERPLEVAAAPPISAPVAQPYAVAAALPESRPADRPEPKPTVASVDAPEKKPAAVVSVVPEGPTPPTPAAAVAPAAPSAAAADRPEPKPAVASLEAPKNTTAPVSPESLTSPVPSAATPAGATPESVAPKQPPNTSVETAPLLERGDRLFGVGDIASARLFYERAAEAGDGQAALRLGETYDPAFLERVQLRVAGDRTLAVFWYRRARELGVAEAEILLKGIRTK